MGLAATTAEVTIQQKQMAALELIYRQTDKTAGDFANTSDSIANRQKILAARFEDAKAAIGESLAPAFEAFLGLLEDAIPLLETTAELIAGLVDLMAGADLSNLQDQYEEINELIEEGLDPAEAAAQVLESHLAPAMDRAADSAFELAQGQARLTLASEGNADTQRIAAQAAAQWEEAQRRAATGAYEASEATDAERESVERLAAAHLAAVNPVIAVFEAQQRHTEAQAALTAAQQSGELTQRELTAVEQEAIQAQLEMEASLMVLHDQMGSNIQQFVEAAERAGLTRDRINELTEALYGIPAYVPIDIDAVVSITGDVGRLESLLRSGDVGHVTVGDSVIGFAEGGVVPGPKDAPMLATVHGGEYVLSNDMLADLARGLTGSLPSFLTRGSGSGSSSDLLANPPKGSILDELASIVGSGTVIDEIVDNVPSGSSLGSMITPLRRGSAGDTITATVGSGTVLQTIVGSVGSGTSLGSMTTPLPQGSAGDAIVSTIGSDSVLQQMVTPAPDDSLLSLITGRFGFEIFGSNRPEPTFGTSGVPIPTTPLTSGTGDVYISIGGSVIGVDDLEREIRGALATSSRRTGAG
jgi:hypothetical protein